MTSIFESDHLLEVTSFSVDLLMFEHALTGNSLETKSLKHNLALKLFIQNPILMKNQARKSAGERRENTVQC